MLARGDGWEVHAMCAEALECPQEQENAGAETSKCESEQLWTIEALRF